MKKHLPFSCQDVQACAAALLDEQLAPAEVEMVEEHLRQCQSCAEMIDNMDEQRLEPPNLQILQNEAYWEEMDSVLQAELEQAERPNQTKISPIHVVLYPSLQLMLLPALLLYPKLEFLLFDFV